MSDDNLSKIRDLMLARVRSQGGRLGGLLDMWQGAPQQQRLPSVMDNYQPPAPQNRLQDYVNTEEPLGPPSILGGLLSLDPTDYMGPQTLAKLAAGAKGLLSGAALMPMVGGMKNVGILSKPKNEITKEDLMKVADRLAIHQDVRPGSADRVSSIMERGLDRGMVDPFEPYVTGKGWSWGRGKVGAEDVYLFDRDSLKYRGKGNPALKEGNMPLVHFTKSELDDLLSK